MSVKAPLVSIVIPTYNRSACVVKAVDSVLNQTFTDYELIVVDDGSTDDTKRNLDRYGDKIIYIYQNNSGVSAARNAGVTFCRGQWLAFLDSDDEWKPDYLAKQITRANTIPGLCMQAANCLFTYNNEGGCQTYFEINGAMAVFKRKGYVLVEEPFAFVVSHQPWQIGSVIVRRDAAIKAGLFDADLKFSEDFDFLARVSLQGPLGLIKEELVDIYRRDETAERLTHQAKKAPLEFKESDDRIYQKLKLKLKLSSKERKALNRAMSANRRAIGNLMLEAGNIERSRDCYKRALFIDPSLRSFGKFIISYLLPPGLALAAIRLRAKRRRGRISPE
jgi:glycosyltransferase involved in cell wall biosynthesis